jgi:hypothetical protein
MLWHLTLHIHAKLFHLPHLTPLSLTLPPPPYALLLHFIVLAMVDGHGIKFPFPYLGPVRQF